MNPIIIDRSQHIVSRKNISAEALKVLYRLREAGFLACLAGGGVRDLLLGRRPKDFDIATDAHPNQVKRLFRNCRLIGRRFRLAHVFFPHTIIEVSTFRASAPPAAAPGDASPPAAAGHHVKSADGVIMRDNVFGTPPEDALRRDFTINALFYNIADFSIVDYVGGLQDLDARRLRVIGDPRVRFLEDPVRMIRAVRFSAMLDFTIEETARQAILEMKDSLALASKERMYEEMRKVIFCGEAERALKALMDMGLFSVLFPDAGAWYTGETPAAEAGRARLFKALRQVDIWKKAGLQPGDPLLWALLFAAYHEARAAEASGGRLLAAALARAAHEHLLNQANRVQIPRNVVRGTTDILAVQPAFLRTAGKSSQRLAGRPVFRDAYVYFKLGARARGGQDELIRWWDQLARGPAARPGREPDEISPRPTTMAEAGGSVADSPKSGDSTG